MARKLYSINLMMVLIISMSAISQTQGKAILITHLVDFKIEGKFTSSFNTNIWYCGNVSIQEVPKLHMVNDSSGQKNYFRVNYYLVINPILKKYVYYKNFSDTAKVVIEYKGSNPPFSKYGGWNMYSDKAFDYDESGKLKDTVINAVTYGRYRYSNNRGENRNDYILYTTSDKTKRPIQYLKYFSEKIGQPVVRMDIYFNNKLVNFSEFQYVSDSFTEEEKKVFEAWSKDVNR